MAQDQNVRDAMQAIGWTAAGWTAAGHQLDPYRESYAGGWWTINPYVSQRPPVVVAASAPRLAGPSESMHAPPSGPVQPHKDTLTHSEKKLEGQLFLNLLVCPYGLPMAAPSPACRHGRP